MMLAIHILTIKHGEVYLHHGVLFFYILLGLAFVAGSGSSTSTSGIKDMLKDIRDEMRKRNR